MAKHALGGGIGLQDVEKEDARSRAGQNFKSSSSKVTRVFGDIQGVLGENAVCFALNLSMAWILRPREDPSRPGDAELPFAGNNGLPPTVDVKILGIG